MVLKFGEAMVRVTVPKWLWMRPLGAKVVGQLDTQLLERSCTSRPTVRTEVGICGSIGIIQGP